MYDENNFERMWVTPDQASGSYTAAGKTLSQVRAFAPSRGNRNNNDRNQENDNAENDNAESSPQTSAGGIT